MLRLFVQVRAFGEAALSTLLKSGASAEGPPPVNRDVKGETAEVLATLLTLLPEELRDPALSKGNAPATPKYSLLSLSLDFQASLVVDLVNENRYTDKPTWNRCIGVYMTPWLDAERAADYAESVRSHYHAIYQVESHFFRLAGYTCLIINFPVQEHCRAR